MTGGLGILNVGAGDTKISFDKDNPVERDRAAGIVTDMLKRGYAIFIVVGEREGRELYQRAVGFDPNTCEYIVVGDPPSVTVGDKVQADRTGGGSRSADASPKPTGTGEGDAASGRSSPPSPIETRGQKISRGRKNAARRRVEADKTTGVAVARTAGG